MLYGLLYVVTRIHQHQRDYMQHSFVQTLSSFLYQNKKQNHLSFALETNKNKKALFVCYLPEISFATNTEATRLNDRPTIQHLLLKRTERNLSPRNRSLQLHFRRNCRETKSEFLSEPNAMEKKLHKFDYLHKGPVA